MVLILLLGGIPTASADATVRFLTPLDGGQVFGPTLLEIESSLSSVDRVDFHVDGTLVGVARNAPFRHVHDFGLELTRHEISADVFTRGFQEKFSAKILTSAPSIEEAIAIDFVEVPLRITTRNNRIAASDFMIFEDGVPQKVADLAATRSPAKFFFIVDRSLSMNRGKLDAALAAVQKALTHLRTGDTAELVLFNHRVSPSKPISRSSILSRPSIVPSGGTSLRDAVASIPRSGRTFAIVISDGADRSSLMPETEALRKVVRRDLTLYAISLGGGTNRFLNEAAKSSGGKLIRTGSGELSSSLEKILREINSLHTISYQSSSSSKGWRSIVVRPASSRVKVASARKGYFAD